MKAQLYSQVLHIQILSYKKLPSLSYDRLKLANYIFCTKKDANISKALWNLWGLWC